MTSVDVRLQLVDALRLDLVGPEKDSPLKAEVLPQAPSRWYLTGFLVPVSASQDQKCQITAEAQAEGKEEGGGTDDTENRDPPMARQAFFPSSMGLSFLVDGSTRKLHVTARWGDYRPEEKSSVQSAQETQD